jgi:hypothetical protein
MSEHDVGFRSECDGNREKVIPTTPTPTPPTPRFRWSRYSFASTLGSVSPPAVSVDLVVLGGAPLVWRLDTTPCFTLNPMRFR